STPERMYSAPIPFGPPILCAEIVSMSTGTRSTRTGTFPSAWTASEWKTTPASRQRAARASTGCRVPTSLFPHITDTTAGRAASASSSDSGWTRPAPSTPSITSSAPSRPAASAAPITALCSTAEYATAVPAPGCRRAARHRPRTARLSDTVPPEVKYTSRRFAPIPARSRPRAAHGLVLDRRARARRARARAPRARAPPAKDRQVVRHRAARGEVYLAAIRADHGGQPLARLLQPHAGLPAPRVLARRIPGHLLQRGAQRLQHLRSYRRRGRVVEVDPVHSRLHTQFLASHPTPERRGGPGGPLP